MKQDERNNISEEEFLEIYGAKENNLKDISIKIPRDKLVVITGLSGSGKSSLAFETIYAEGQRRYMESMSSYARQFIGNMERPHVDDIKGLSPVISIEQKSVNKNPRSTVGTITEIYDYLRLLYARAAEPFSYNTGEKMVRYSEEQICNIIIKTYKDKKINILAPVVRGRKGHYRELFENIRQQGFLRVRIDGEINELNYGMQVDRYKVHDIEIVIDRLLVGEDKNRINKAVELAFKHGKGLLFVLEEGQSDVRYFSRLLMCPTTGLSYQDPEPNTFSFNSPYGACPKCNGLGEITVIDMNKIIPDMEKSIKKGGLAPLGEYKNSWIFNQLETLGLHYGFTLDTPLKELSEEALNTILYGTTEGFTVTKELYGTMSTFTATFDGLINFIIKQNEDENASTSIKRWAASFMNETQCPECHGTRLKKESLYFKINDKNIAELAEMNIVNLAKWIDELPKHLNKKQKEIATDVLAEIKKRIDFLLNVGIDYLNLNRPSKSLSGGEAQRIRLATQIGSLLTGILYILDEPSIGLHQRDNQRLIESLKELRDIGNSIIVVEHDKDTMLASDYIVDIGPGAGKHGGEITFEGTPKEVKKGKTQGT